MAAAAAAAATGSHPEVTLVPNSKPQTCWSWIWIVSNRRSTGFSTGWSCMTSTRRSACFSMICTSLPNRDPHISDCVCVCVFCIYMCMGGVHCMRVSVYGHGHVAGAYGKTTLASASCRLSTRAVYSLHCDALQAGHNDKVTVSNR
jgi:hypothetical protein